MKLTKFTILATAAIFASAGNVEAAPGTVFPLVKLTISGTASYNASDPSDNGTATKSAPTKVSFTTKSLISLLNASSPLTNTLFAITGTNQIPAGSYFVYDLYNQNLIITNKNGFNFTLYGLDPFTFTNYYDYGYLLIGQGSSLAVGSFSQNDTTGAGKESDLTVIEFHFNDGNGNQFDDYGNGTLKWSFSQESGGVQKTTLSISFLASDGYNDTVNYYPAIAQKVKVSGSGTGNVESGMFPFYFLWPMP